MGMTMARIGVGCPNSNAADRSQEDNPKYDEHDHGDYWRATI
jgi:hypothetical protein